MLKLSISVELAKKNQRGASIPSQLQRGIFHLVKKQSMRVSAWSPAQFQRGGKFQHGNAFSMLELSICVGAESTIVFSRINRTIVKFYQSDGQEAALTRLWIQREVRQLSCRTTPCCRPTQQNVMKISSSVEIQF